MSPMYRLAAILALLTCMASAQVGSSPGVTGGTSGTGNGAFIGAAGNSFQDVTEIAAPANPAGGNERLYADSSTHLLTCLKSSGASCFSASVAWNAITAPSGNLSLTMGSNTSTFNTTTAVSQAFALKNTTAALVGASQSSSTFSLCGTEWHAAASAEGCAAFQFIPGTGTDAANTIALTHTGSATGVTTTTFPGPVQSASDGVHAAYLSLLGNTTAPSITANTAGWLGPSSASFTGYACQLPSTAPSGQVLQCAAPSSGVSVGSWVSAGGGSSIVMYAAFGNAAVCGAGQFTGANNALSPVGEACQFTGAAGSAGSGAVITSTGTMKNFRIHMQQAVPAGLTYTFTVYWCTGSNCVPAATTIVATCAAGAFDCVDTTHTQAVTAGDLFAYREDQTGSGTEVGTQFSSAIQVQ